MNQKLVKYTFQNGAKVYDVNQALKASGWGVSLGNLATIGGLVVKDRNDPAHTERIERVARDPLFNMFFVHWVGCGWNCLDHAIEQFELGE